MDDFFDQEEGAEFEKMEVNELVFRYEEMIRNNHSIYLTSDDYENLFIYYMRFDVDSIAFENMDMKMADKVIRDGVEQYPKAPLLQMFSIYYKYLMKEYCLSKAICLLKDVEFPKYEKTDLEIYLADIFVKIGALPEAVLLYEELLKHAQTDGERVEFYHELLLLTLHEDGEDEKKDIHKINFYLEKLIELEPEKEKMYLEHIYFSSCMPDELLQLLELYVNNHLFSAPGWVLLAEEYSKKRARFDEAIKAIDNAIALSDTSEPLVTKGDIYRRREKNKKALECYLEAALLSPEDRNVYKNIADTYFETGEMRKAAYYYHLLLEKDPDNVHLLFSMGFIYFEECKYDISLQYMERAKNLYHVDEEVLDLWSRCLIELDKEDRITTYFEQMVEQEPEWIYFWLAYSNYYVIIEDYLGALNILFRGMNVVKENARLVYRMANCFFLDGDNASGIAYLRLAYMIDSDYLYVFLDYDEETGRLPQVVDTINELTRINNLTDEF